MVVVAWALRGAIGCKICDCGQEDVDHFCSKFIGYVRRWNVPMLTPLVDTFPEDKIVAHRRCTPIHGWYGRQVVQREVEGRQHLEEPEGPELLHIRHDCRSNCWVYVCCTYLTLVLFRLPGS